MYNWSTDTKTLSKDPEKHVIWQMEQLIHYGLDENKLKRSDLKKNLNKLRIDTQKKTYLKYLLSSK